MVESEFLALANRVAARLADTETESAARLLPELERVADTAQESRLALVSAWLDCAKALLSVKSAERVGLAVESSTRAIALCEQLPPEIPDQRHRLGNAWIALGNALRANPTREGLRHAIEAYDRAIELHRQHPSDAPMFRKQLAAAWIERGIALEGVRTTDGLREAVKSHDVAIALGQDLPLEVPEYRNELGRAWSNRANALWKLGTIDSLRAAVESADAAIELCRQLPLDVPEYRGQLAQAWLERGKVLRERQTADSQRGSVEAHKKATELCQELPLSISDYVNRLTIAWWEHGLSLEKMRTPESWRAAVGSYDNAIHIGRRLPLEVAEYRRTLARAWWGRGDALREMNTPDSLREAVKSYDESIHLDEQLPLDVPDYLDDLVVVWSSRGVALGEMKTTDSLRAAVGSFETAVDLGKQQPFDVPRYRDVLANSLCSLAVAHLALRQPDARQQALRRYEEALSATTDLSMQVPEFVDTRALALTNAAITRMELARKNATDRADLFERAADHTDEALGLLRDVERRGVFTLRKRREWMFPVALEAKLLHEPQFVAETVLEHLDPNSAGAAPESVEMHEAAFRFLLQAHKFWCDAERTAQKPSASTRREEVEKAMLRLQQLGALYFSGTADAAGQEADYHKRRGARSAAYQVLLRYRDQHPRDARGHAQLARLFHEDGQFPRARTEYMHAVDRWLDGLVDASLRDDPAWPGGGLEQIVQAVWRTLLPTLPAPGKKAEVAARIEVRDAQKWISSWVNSLCERYSDPLGEPGRAELRRALDGIDDELREWDATFTVATREQAVKAPEPVISAEALRRVFDAMGRSWPAVSRDLFEAMVAFHKVMTQEPGANPQQAHNAHVDAQADRINAATLVLRNVVRVVLRDLHATEIAGYEARAAEVLGAIWASLNADERREIALGLRCMDEPTLERFAGLTFGQIVEGMLLRRLFTPARDRLHTEGRKLQEPPRDKFPDFVLTRYLNGKADLLLLGASAEAFNQAFFSSPGDSAQHYEVVRAHGRATGAPLFPPDTAAGEARYNGLERICEVRNACAHPGRQVTTRDVREAWQSLAVRPEAFLRYFVPQDRDEAAEPDERPRQTT